MIWKSSFAIGIEGIDRQHELLLTYLNECLEHSTDIAGVFDRLNTYAWEHFAGEERLMSSINYPTLKGHQQQHRLFEEQLEQLRETIKNNERQAISSLVSFMRDWFLDHILVADASYARYMRSTMDEADIAILAELGYK